MSFSTDDTIVAIATPPGQGGVGIVRLSGPQAWDIGQRLFARGQAPALQGDHKGTPLHSSGVGTEGRERARHGWRIRSHHLYYGRIIDPASGQALDDGLIAFMRGPHSYTGEDVVEINAHGAPVVLRQIVAAALAQGTRAAEPGEMTLRAFLHGRLDLAQAEAVADLIAANSEAAARQALGQLDGRLSVHIQMAQDALLRAMAPIEASIDFPEDEVPPPDPAELDTSIATAAAIVGDLLASAGQGRIVREGVRCVITGRPNVGKSSLLNYLLRAERAIVTPTAGTTRDTIEASTLISGVAFHLIDTAGIATTDDPIEQLGIARSRAALAAADLALLVLDRAAPLTDADRALWDEVREQGFGTTRGLILVLNKSDLPEKLDATAVAEMVESAGADGKVSLHTTSIITGAGLAALEEALVTAALGGPATEGAALVARARHAEALQAAAAALAAARATLSAGLPLDLVAEDLRDAMHALGLITGATVTDDLLGAIFSEFCIGK
jgi:tRNA modification GTPase